LGLDKIVSREFVPGPHSAGTGASVGIAYCRDGYVDADRILNEADAALYRAKTGGRGRVDVFEVGRRARIEYPEQADRHRSVAAEYGQVYLFSRPEPSQNFFPTLLRRRPQAVQPRS
jgi:predicted signal transduction protein with EAL and GGDEF domain